MVYMYMVQYIGQRQGRRSWGDGGDIYPPLFHLGGMTNVIISPPLFPQFTEKVQQRAQEDHTKHRLTKMKAQNRRFLAKISKFVQKI